MATKLPRSQTSLSLQRWWARKGGREGEKRRDVVVSPLFFHLPLIPRVLLPSFSCFELACLRLTSEEEAGNRGLHERYMCNRVYLHWKWSGIIWGQWQRGDHHDRLFGSSTTFNSLLENFSWQFGAEYSKQNLMYSFTERCDCSDKERL